MIFIASCDRSLYSRSRSQLSSLLRWIFVFALLQANSCRLVSGVLTVCQQNGQIQKNVTIKGGLKEGRLQYLGHASTMLDCVALCCKNPDTSAAYLAKGKCYGIKCGASHRNCELTATGKPSSSLFVRVWRYNSHQNDKQQSVPVPRNASKTQKSSSHKTSVDLHIQRNEAKRLHKSSTNIPSPVKESVLHSKQLPVLTSQSGRADTNSSDGQQETSSGADELDNLSGSGDEVFELPSSSTIEIMPSNVLSHVDRKNERKKDRYLVGSTRTDLKVFSPSSRSSASTANTFPGTVHSDSSSFTSGSDLVSTQTQTLIGEVEADAVSNLIYKTAAAKKFRTKNLSATNHLYLQRTGTFLDNSKNKENNLLNNQNDLITKGAPHFGKAVPRYTRKNYAMHKGKLPENAEAKEFSRNAKHKHATTKLRGDRKQRSHVKEDTKRSILYSLGSLQELHRVKRKSIDNDDEDREETDSKHKAREKKHMKLDKASNFRGAKSNHELNHKGKQRHLVSIKENSRYGDSKKTKKKRKGKLSKKKKHKRQSFYAVSPFQTFSPRGRVTSYGPQTLNRLPESRLRSGPQLQNVRFPGYKSAATQRINTQRSQMFSPLTRLRGNYNVKMLVPEVQLPTRNNINFQPAGEFNNVHKRRFGAMAPVSSYATQPQAQRTGYAFTGSNIADSQSIFPDVRSRAHYPFSEELIKSPTDGGINYAVSPDLVQGRVLHNSRLVPSQSVPLLQPDRKNIIAVDKPLSYSQGSPPLNTQYGVKTPPQLERNPYAKYSTIQSPVGISQSDSQDRSLIVYLNFDDVYEGKALDMSYHGNAADLGKRTDIMKSFHSCGNVARVNRGSSIVFDGRIMKVKPRDAVSMAAWIRLENNEGVHSIFDTIGNHSNHRQGQYHFEVKDAALRWFHRNEFGDTVFSVESAPVIPAKRWTHVTGVYDAHTGVARVFVNARARASVHGKGLLSQDWDGHAGIGNHKGERFLNGEIDEFRIYSKVLTRKEIEGLMERCKFPNTCGGPFYSPVGTLESPYWPVMYNGKATCTWNITVPPSQIISLHFIDLNVADCHKSRVTVRDDATNDIVGVYCGHQTPRVVRTAKNHLLVQFASEGIPPGGRFRLNYNVNTETFKETKKTVLPHSRDSTMATCAATEPEYNVTLLGGMRSGNFTEVSDARELDSCMRHCCSRSSCDLAFMIRDNCYLVDCFSTESCRTKKARPSNMSPRIAFIKHLKDQNSGVTAVDNATAREQCHHTAVSYNVTLLGGVHAGKFSTYGQPRDMGECIRLCCHDDACDVAFMVQGNCYTVQCADRKGCQMKRARTSPYNPTIAYIYRGQNKPIGDTLPAVTKPSNQACTKTQVGATQYNVTLRGGIKAGKFLDKGIVGNMKECTRFCCAEDTCNVAFLIRDNCFLVACKDYNGCRLKPALSEYYHPQLAYVNWDPPVSETQVNQSYASLGCWRDTDASAMPRLEGSDALLTADYHMRPRPIDTCAAVARKHDYKVFAVQNGGACLGGPRAEETFAQFGPSTDCSAGKGGIFAFSAYRCKPEGSYTNIGCWKDSVNRTMLHLEQTDPVLNDFYKTRPSPIEKCAEVSRRRGYTTFAIQDGGLCFSGPNASIAYKLYGISRDCRNGQGGPYANSVYRIIGNVATPTDSESSYNIESPSTENSATKGSLSGTVETPGDKSTSEQGGEDGPSFDRGTQEDFVVMENGHAQRVAYVAGPIIYNVTLRLGIKAGKFADKGRQKGMKECIRSCGKEQSCDVAFMLGKQCFAVTCNKGELCQTKPAYSKFYNPQIAYVKHRELVNKVKSNQEEKVCHSSEIKKDVTLVGGINAGKFTDLGHVDNSSVCVQRCCKNVTCDVAFILENECYGVSCLNDQLCEVRRARNPQRYNPQIAYVYHSKAKDKGNVTIKTRLKAAQSFLDYFIKSGQPQQTGTSKHIKQPYVGIVSSDINTNRYGTTGYVYGEHPCTHTYIHTHTITSCAPKFINTHLKNTNIRTASVVKTNSSKESQESFVQKRFVCSINMSYVK